MNDIEFIETLKQKRNACDYSQSRLAQELQISRQNLNEIENGKTKASKEMKHILLHYLDYCNCTQPFTLTIDYLRVRFPTTDALEIIKNVLAMKSEYFIHEDYGMFGYEEQYIYGDISVNASKDSSMGVLLELRGMGCRNLEYVLQARGIDWYYFLSSCIDYQGVFKRIDLAVNDMGGLLDIEILRERYYANKVWKRSRTHEAVDSGKLSGTHGDTAKTFYIGSKNSSIYFCLYEKEKEQKSKGIKTDIKNRFEIRLKSGKAEQTIEQLVFSRNPEQTIASLILTQIDFPVYILSFIEVTNKKNRELLQEYAKYHVGIGGLTIANIRGQLYEVKRLLEYFKEEESICQVDENQLDDYFRKLEEKDTKDDTFNKRIVHYIKFYQFLNVRGYMKEIPFKPEYYLKKTYPEHHDRTVEEKVYMEILHKLYAFPLVPRLIFLHLWCTGLRISEVCTLKGDAYYWDGEDAWLKVYQIKMKADKMIPIPLVMYRIMRKYIEREHIRPKDYIFKGKDGGAYRGTTFRQEFQQYCDKNGIADGSYIFKTHDYRHTLATQFYDEDVSIQTIRDYLGHFSEEMTKQYVDFMPKRIEKASDTYFKKPENDLASTIKAKKRGERK